MINPSHELEIAQRMLAISLFITQLITDQPKPSYLSPIPLMRMYQEKYHPEHVDWHDFSTVLDMLHTRRVLEGAGQDKFGHMRYTIRHNDWNK